MQGDTPIQPPLAHDPPRLAVLISGTGTTMQAIAQRIEANELRARIALVLSSRADAGGLERAAAMNLPTAVVARRDHASPEQFSAAVFEHIRAADADLVCMAGFLSLLAIPEDYAASVLNLHPALLPAFGGQGMYGKHVHRAVLDAGCKVSGCTVHFADQQYDRGPIVVQRCVPVRDDDTPATLAERVAEQEHDAYIQAIELIAQRRVWIEGQRTRIEP